ncbi:glutamyl-tRNA reductase [Arthrobacter sp. H14]|uniref:glutamyl-tRNA reductase n=1 Tax=Arthrobacter sp. H14 TaxID=1312959 RepID=UPI0009DE7815|nr:glutamyl-tRNA reductase [Arthrobacter sp. H14]
MNLLSLVATHSDVDLETIARLSAGSSEVATAVLDDGHPVSGAVVLATCNRYEIYCELPSGHDAEEAKSALFSLISDNSGIDKHLVARAFTVNTGVDVSRHLFSVGAGLDSAVVGEREIAGQVRRALIEAQENGTASGGLTRLFQTASRTAKDVGSQTGLGQRGLSIVSVALELATDLALEPEWAGKNVVIIGTGAYAGATMSLLRERGCSDVSVFSASGRAESFVATRGGTALTRQTLPDALAAADVVIGCSGGDTRVEADAVERVRAGSDKPLTVIDLALTHDFDPSVGELADVELITLESVRLAAPQEQKDSLTEARRIVVEAAEKFEHQQKSRTVDAAIVALRKHTHNVLDVELERVRSQHGCTAAGEEVEFALRRMVKQLLHIPTVRGRELAANGDQDTYIAALEALYGIEVEEPAAAPRAEKTSEQTFTSGGSGRSGAAGMDSCPVSLPLREESA